MKKLILLASLAFSINAFAQVPSYVPTNGLASWYPFTGNANDLSGNNNNGTVNGATLTTDRFGNTNSAYTFDGLNDFIDVLHSSSLSFATYQQTISFWMKVPSIPHPSVLEGVMSKYSGTGNLFQGFTIHFAGNSSLFYSIKNGSSSGSWGDCPLDSTNFYPSNSYYHIVYTNDNDSLRCYVNGIKIISTDIPSGTFLGTNTSSLVFGKESYMGGGVDFFNGELDDIGIWNRAITACEVLDLYNAQLGTFSNTVVSLNPASSLIGSNATLSVSTPIQNIQWQSNPSNVGWVNLSDNANYNGVNNDTLLVSNLQLSNHNQPFRVLACGVTSNISTIQIADTCITNSTVYDTLLTTVTDTLVINALITGINPPNNQNTLKVFPNPSSSHVSIDYGNFNAMSGYTLKIVNAVGQTVFTTPINQQTSYIDLSTWTGNGIYFVQLIDPQNNTIENRKIVIQ